MKLAAPESAGEWDVARVLIRELMAWDQAEVGKLGLDSKLMACFYYSSGELALPGEYAPPEGRLLLATEGADAAGCGAFARFDDASCELKRVYVRPAFRGQKLGEQIVTTLLDEARASGYRSMKLETVAFMTTAIATYRRLGFVDCPAYYEIPETFRPITLFMERAL